MRGYTWAEYYDKYWQWAESTAIRNLSQLTSLGPADQVAEVISYFSNHPSAANRLLARAVDEKIAFSGSDLADFALDDDLDKKMVGEAALLSADQISFENLNDLYGELDDKYIVEICKKTQLPPPTFMTNADEYGLGLLPDPPEEDPFAAYLRGNGKSKGLGLKGWLLALFLGWGNPDQ